jgi:hypothetical protein
LAGGRLDGRTRGTARPALTCSRGPRDELEEEETGISDMRCCCELIRRPRHRSLCKRRGDYDRLPVGSNERVSLAEIEQAEPELQSRSSDHALTEGSPLWPGRSVRSHSPRLGRRHQRSRSPSGRRRPHAASRPRLPWVLARNLTPEGALHCARRWHCRCISVERGGRGSPTVAPPLPPLPPEGAPLEPRATEPALELPATFGHVGHNP